MNEATNRARARWLITQVADACDAKERDEAEECIFTELQIAQARGEALERLRVQSIIKGAE